MDDVDGAILDLLQSDARLTNRDLAERLGIAPSTCLDRVRSLKERGVIRGFHADVSLASLGREVQAMVSVSLRPQSRQVIESFRAFVLSLKETLGVYVVTGDEDVLIHVAVPSTHHLQDFVLDRLTHRSEIATLRTAVVYDHRSKTNIEAFPAGTRRDRPGPGLGRGDTGPHAEGN